MKKLMLLLAVLSFVACGNKTDTNESAQNTSEPAQTTKMETTPKPQQNTQKQTSAEMPNLADYQGVCPKIWGLVNGAPQTRVEKFIQNFFYVPENPGKMYSDINTFTQNNGSTLIKAATYNMQDTIVDQEMVTVFVAEKMTMCGVRFRCATNVNQWVSSCDE